MSGEGKDSNWSNLSDDSIDGSVDVGFIDAVINGNTILYYFGEVEAIAGNLNFRMLHQSSKQSRQAVTILI